MEKVLQLESGKFFRELVKMIIEPRGFELITTDSSLEAFEILKNNEVSLIITANELIDSSGEEFIKKINQTEYSSIPVIILTSTDSLELRTRLFSMGIVDYILKKDMTARRLESYFDSLIKQDTLLRQIQEESIAILDDSRLGLSIVKNIFKLHKITNVGYYTDPEEFLNDAKKYSFFLVDLVLPGISGEEVIMKLRKQKKNAIIIVVSGISNFKTVSHALMCGADDYITKPFDNAIFMARLKSNARSYFLYKEIEKLAVTDGLTGLYNHKYICNHVEFQILEKKKMRTPFCIMLLDIDHFKTVNDRYGHQTGDLVLTALSRAINDNFSEKSVCGRYGGEEFLVVMDNTGLKDGVSFAERFREEVAGLDYAGFDFRITISAGIVEHSGETASELIKKADDLLYNAKENGRNRVMF